jgi:hypothetical protein
MMGIKEVVTAARSPWQNAYVERIIGSVRRECLDHVIVFDEHHLRGVLSSYFHYLPQDENASLARQGLSGEPTDTPAHCRQDYPVPGGRGPPSSLRTTCGLNLSGWLYSCDGSGVEGCSVPQLCPPNAMLPIAPL